MDAAPGWSIQHQGPRGAAPFSGSVARQGPSHLSRCSAVLRAMRSSIGIPSLLVLIAFLITFGLTRAITFMIRLGVGPLHNVTSGGLHIHHMVWGILILLAVGYLWLVHFGAGETPIPKCVLSVTILPTSFEVGVLNGQVSPGDTVAIVGAGPIGLAAVLTARLFSPGKIIAIDLADTRLERAKEFGADLTINNGEQDAVLAIKAMTEGLGVDVAIEAVGVPATFELCADLVKPGGRVANVGVHGHPAALHLEKLWIRDVTITTGLVDTYSIPRLLSLIRGGRLDPRVFITHRFALDGLMDACDVFADAARSGALKVVMNRAMVCFGNPKRKKSSARTPAEL